VLLASFENTSARKRLEEFVGDFEFSQTFSVSVTQQETNMKCFFYLQKVCEKERED